MLEGAVSQRGEGMAGWDRRDVGSVLIEMAMELGGAFAFHSRHGETPGLDGR